VFFVSSGLQAQDQAKNSFQIRSGLMRSHLIESSNWAQYELPLWTPAISASYSRQVFRHVSIDAQLSYFSVGGVSKYEETTIGEPDGTGRFIYSSLQYDYISPSVQLSFVYPIESYELISSVGPRFDFLVMGSSFNKQELLKMHNQGWDVSLGVNKRIQSKTLFNSRLGYHTFGRDLARISENLGTRSVNYRKPGSSFSLMFGFGFLF
jgi:hypothetical protein